MSKTTKTTTTSGALIVGIILIQVLDIFIHAATDQLEILRIASNLAIFLWLAVVTVERFAAKFHLTSFLSVSAYLAFNIVFLAINGVTNFEQGGELRIALFLLMFSTIVLSSLLAFTWKRNPN